MSTNMADRWNSGHCVCQLFLLSVFVATCAARNTACDGWAHLANELSGNGKTQLCVNDQTNLCTRFDCEGTLRIKNAHIGELKLDDMAFDYCFGSQLNACSHPLSMDFYLQLPARHYEFKHTISHNDKLTLDNLKISFKRLGKAVPVFIFQFDKNLNSSVHFSVFLRVEVTVAGITTFLPGFDQTLIDEMDIPVPPCSNKKKAASDFQLSQCHVKKYPNASKPASVMKPAIKPSDTLNKSCDFVSKPCSHGEICNGVLSQLTCECGPDFQLSDKKDACMALSNMGQPCTSMSDCGYHEHCQKSGAKGQICQCDHGYEFDAARESCMVSHGHKHDVSTQNPTHVDGGGKKDTNKKTQDEPSKSSMNKYIIIGASVGVAVLLAVVLVVGFICYRRRRNVLRVDLNETDQPLLSQVGDDDDMNIIM